MFYYETDTQVDSTKDRTNEMMSAKTHLKTFNGMFCTSLSTISLVD